MFEPRGGSVGVAVAAVGLLVLATGCTSLLGGGQVVESTFEDGTENWTVVGDAQGGSSQPTHHEAGGASGGYVSSTDDTTGGVWYWNASPAYLGDRSGFYGGTLSFELDQSRTDSQFDDTDVILAGGDRRLGYDFGNESTHPGTNWTAYEVPLREDGWVDLETGEPATREEFEEVLSDLEGVFVRGEYRDGSDVGGLDEVTLSSS